jgi:hypothetical protein
LGEGCVEGGEEGGREVYWGWSCCTFVLFLGELTNSTRVFEL